MPKVGIETPQTAHLRGFVVVHVGLALSFLPIGIIAYVEIIRNMRNNDFLSYENSNLPRFINNNGGNGKTVSTTNWVYLGTNITIPDGYVAILYAQRGYHTGAPNGVCISASSTDMRSAVRAINQPTDAEYNNYNIHITMLVGAGTYYLWSKGEIGISSEFIHAVLFGIR